MGLIVKQADDTKDFPMPSSGPHAARCYQVVDLGIKDKGGQYPGKAHKIRLAFEIDELMEDGRPFSISETLTMSLNEKAKLYQRLVSWRGRAFTDEELEAFDLKKLINAPCLINVIINESGGKHYANINSITPLPKSMKAEALLNEPLVWECGDSRSKLPEWLDSYIGEDPTPRDTSDSYGDVNMEDDLDSDLPF